MLKKGFAEGGYSMFKKPKRMIGAVLAAILLLCSCSGSRIKSTNYEDRMSEKDDFNYTALSWLYTNDCFTEPEEGLFYVVGSYLFFSNAETMEGKPLCFKPECLHNDETDPEKVPDCDAFLGASYGGSYIGYFQNQIYVTALNKSTQKRELIRMEKDGSGRETIFSDLSMVDIPNIRMHRGVLYYFTSSIDAEGKADVGFHVYSLLDRRKKDQVMYSWQLHDCSPFQLLPIGNRVYFEVEKGNDNDGYAYDLLMLNIATGEVTQVFSGDQYMIYGARDNKLILRNQGVYYELSSDGTLAEENHGLNALTEAHPDWQVHLDCADSELNFFSCFDREGGGFIEDMIVTDLSGRELCRLEGEAWGDLGAEIAVINNERYYVKQSTSLAPFSVKAYRVEDLKKGNTDYAELLKADEYNRAFSPSYILPNPE